GGWGHGIGMSQYGAHGMALRGASAGRIISFYYGGAQARPATLPATIRVGLLQAKRDPSTGGRLGRVLVRGVEVPGRGGSGRFSVSGVTRGGRTVRRSLGGHTTWSIRPESGGTSVFDPSGRRVFGPTRAGTGVVVRFETALPPARLSLPQTGQQLRWGRLDVHLVRDDRGVTRPRAVAVVPFNRYLRGLAEMPGSFANEALRAQAIAARSYALVAVRTRGQRWGTGAGTAATARCTPPSATRPSPATPRSGATTDRGGSRPFAAPARWSSATAPGSCRRSTRPRRAGTPPATPSGGAPRCPGSRAAPTTPTTAAAAPTPTVTSAGPCGCRRPPWAPASGSASR
ncbi:MAG TPA: SpoIID/LytB domain-containing protein, partial [Actinomycetes bacterium]|nr:SpoIID/LytB domain-containing protein [Actinomycetes bacterium]